ncbi:hypothetical protein KIN20_023745 [Parelaphostrongylus tenuis]|uniref:Uncharacterized protein n=1 Tax=Parelaphostrongylus tenuis TaxID=148309 RepID=A0AAD5N7G8_PARTN|nr:hypothetical protein KIN20_023745 [Parelaphostrongylus tenuis]
MNSTSSGLSPNTRTTFPKRLSAESHGRLAGKNREGGPITGSRCVDTVLGASTSVIFRFEEAASQEDADINILWAEGAHGDQYPMINNTLPHIGWDIRQDNDIHISNNRSLTDYVLRHNMMLIARKFAQKVRH